MLRRVGHALLALAVLPVLLTIFSALLVFYALVYVFEAPDA